MVALRSVRAERARAVSGCIARLGSRLHSIWPRLIRDLAALASGKLGSARRRDETERGSIRRGTALYVVLV